MSTFSKFICPKVTVTARQEFELAYYDSVVKRFNLYLNKDIPPYFLSSHYTMLCDCP